MADALPGAAAPIPSAVRAALHTTTGQAAADLEQPPATVPAPKRAPAAGDDVAVLSPVQLLRALDGWLDNTGYDDTHPWRLSILTTLAVHGASVEPCGSMATAGAGAPSQAAEPRPQLDRFTPRNVMQLLMSKAGPQLAGADLQRIAEGGLAHVEFAAHQAACVAEGLGCLVAHDEQVGSFRDDAAVSGLIFQFSHQFEHLAAFAAVASCAASELASRGDQ